MGLAEIAHFLQLSHNTANRCRAEVLTDMPRNHPGSNRPARQYKGRNRAPQYFTGPFALEGIVRKSHVYKPIAAIFGLGFSQPEFVRDSLHRIAAEGKYNIGQVKVKQALILRAGHREDRREKQEDKKTAAELHSRKLFSCNLAAVVFSLDQGIERNVGVTHGFSDRFAGDKSAVRVDPFPERRVSLDRFLET
jgi:hypothetical protein